MWGSLYFFIIKGKSKYQFHKSSITLVQDFIPKAVFIHSQLLYVIKTTSIVLWEKNLFWTKICGWIHTLFMGIYGLVKFVFGFPFTTYIHSSNFQKDVRFLHWKKNKASNSEHNFCQLNDYEYFFHIFHKWIEIESIFLIISLISIFSPYHGHFFSKPNRTICPQLKVIFLSNKARFYRSQLKHKSVAYWVEILFEGAFLSLCLCVFSKYFN